MNTSYGRSPMGYAWAILQPLGGVVLLVLVFSAGFRSPPLGVNFALFYATGFLPFVYFTDISGKLGQSLNYSRPFLAYPRITFVDAMIARFILNALTQILVGYLIFAGILLIYETRTTLVMERVLMSYAMASAFALGVGSFNCFLISLSPTWQQVWSILTRPLFLISGVFLLYDSMPEPFRSILWYNPLIHVTGEMRAAFYVSYEAPYVSPYYVFGLSLVLTTFGMLFLRRYHRDIIYR